MPVSPTPTLMELLAIRLSPQAGKSLVIPRKERGQTNREASQATSGTTRATHWVWSEMDFTHREFIAQLAALIAAGNAEFPALFQALVNHTAAHFKAEGVLMRATKYRGLPEHESGTPSHPGRVAATQPQPEARPLAASARLREGRIAGVVRYASGNDGRRAGAAPEKIAGYPACWRYARLTPDEILLTNHIQECG